MNSVRRRDFELLAACQIAENCYLIGNAEKREYVSAGVTAAEGSAVAIRFAMFFIMSLLRFDAPCGSRCSHDGVSRFSRNPRRERLIYKNEVTTQTSSNVHAESIPEARLKLLSSAIDPPTPTCI